MNIILKIKFIFFLFLATFFFASNCFAAIGLLPGEEPPYMGTGLIGDPDGGSNIYLPSPVLYPNPPQPGIRTLVYYFIGNDQTISSNNANTLKNLKLHYRYKLYDLEQKCYEGENGCSGDWHPSSNWNFTGTVMTKMYNCTIPSNCTDANLNDVDTITPGKQTAPTKPIQSLDERVRPYIWVGILPDLPPYTKIEYLAWGEDTSAQQYVPNGGGNVNNKFFAEEKVGANVIGEKRSIPSTMTGVNSGRDLDNPTSSFFNPGAWTPLMTDPSELGNDPYPPALTAGYLVYPGALSPNKFQFPPGYAIDYFYEGKHIDDIHHPRLLKILPSQLKKMDPQLYAKVMKEKQKKFQAQDPCAQPPDQGGGGGGGGGGGEEPVNVWIYPCNSSTTSPVKPYETGLAGMPPVYDYNTDPDHDPTKPCTEDPTNRFYQWLQTQNADNAARIKTGFSGDHSHPARCHPRTTHVAYNPTGIDLRSASVFFNVNTGTFMIKFSADGNPDQDVDSGWGEWADLIQVAWDLLLSKKVWWIDLWVVRIVNPDGGVGYLLYLPLLYNFLNGTVAGQIAQIIPAVFCALKSYAITSSKAHILGSLADLMSTDPSVMSPVVVSGDLSDDANKTIYFDLPTGADNWNTFIKTKNPSKRYGISLSTMAMPISLGKDQYGPLLDLSLDIDVASILGVPVPVDTTAAANYYTGDVHKAVVQPDFISVNLKDKTYGLSTTTWGTATAINDTKGCPGTCGSLDSANGPKSSFTGVNLDYIQISWTFLQNLSQGFANIDGSRVINNTLGAKPDFDPTAILTSAPRGGFNIYRRYCKNNGTTADCTSSWSSWNQINFDSTGNWEWMYNYSGNSACPNGNCWVSVDQDPKYFTGQTAILSNCSTSTNQTVYGDSRPQRGKNEVRDILNWNGLAKQVTQWYIGLDGSGNKVWKKATTNDEFNYDGNNFFYNDKILPLTPAEQADATIANNPTYNLLGGYTYQYMVAPIDWPNPFCSHRNTGKQAGWSGFGQSFHWDSDGANERYLDNYLFVDLLNPNYIKVDTTTTPDKCTTSTNPDNLSELSGLRDIDPPYNEGPGILSLPIGIKSGAPAPLQNNLDVSADLNGDGVVDLTDFGILRAAFNSKPGDANWNASADLNNDGKVSLIDFGLMAKQFKKAKGIP